LEEVVQVEQKPIALEQGDVLYQQVKSLYQEVQGERACVGEFDLDLQLMDGLSFVSGT
jgi:hypothetical protein